VYPEMVDAGLLDQGVTFGPAMCL